jgi:hypothetical protein
MLDELGDAQESLAHIVAQRFELFHDPMVENFHLPRHDAEYLKSEISSRRAKVAAPGWPSGVRPQTADSAFAEEIADAFAETDDADPARVAVVQDVTAAYLRSVLDGDGRAWADAQRSLTIGRIDSK